MIVQLCKARHAGVAARSGCWVHPRHLRPSPTLRGPFLLGLTTQLGNPKTAVVYGSVFAAFLPAALPAWVLVALPPLIFAVEAGWYAVVALAFSAEKPRTAYLRSKMLADRTASTVIGLLGIKLVVEAARATWPA